MQERYETPEVEFIEIEKEDVIVTSGGCNDVAGRGVVGYEC